MAKSGIVVCLGAVSLPSGFNMDVQTMRIHEKQDKENVTPYVTSTSSTVTASTTAYGFWRGTGTPMQDITCTGFPYKGAGTAASNVGLGQMAYNNNSNAALGVTAVFTLDNGVSITGTYLTDELTIDHSRIVAGAKTTLMLANTGDITVAWATS